MAGPFYVGVNNQRFRYARNGWLPALEETAPPVLPPPDEKWFEGVRLREQLEEYNQNLDVLQDDLREHSHQISELRDSLQSYLGAIPEMQGALKYLLGQAKEKAATPSQKEIRL